MAKKTPPRKARNIKAAAEAAENASVEIASSNCTAGETLEAVNLYEFYGFGNSLQTYTQGEITDFASQGDIAKQTNGKDASGVTRIIKDANNIIQRLPAAGLSTNGANYYFNTTQTAAGSGPRGGLTGSNLPAFIYGKNGPQAPYIPQLVHSQDGLTTGTEYVFFFPSILTGAAASPTLPVGHSASFEITIAGAVGAGESVRVYCQKPNYSKTQVRILTGSIDAGNPATSQAGVVIVYSASYTADGTKENTPYAGVIATLNPSGLVSPM